MVYYVLQYFRRAFTMQTTVVKLEFAKSNFTWTTIYAVTLRRELDAL